MKFTVGDDKKTLITERTFKARAHKLWAAYSEAELFAKWWGPRGWDTEVRHMDFREGGYLHYGMTCVDPEQKDWFGKSSWAMSTYTKIVPEQLLAYTDAFCDEDGEIFTDMPTMDVEVKFVANGDHTKLINTTTFASEEALTQIIEMGVEEGFRQTWDCLEDFLQG